MLVNTFIFSLKCTDFIGIFFKSFLDHVARWFFFSFFFLGVQNGKFLPPKKSLIWTRKSSHIFDNEFLEVAKQIGFLKSFYFPFWHLPKIGSFLFWMVASPPTWQNWKNKIPDVGKPAIETNKETNSRQITMLTSGNANKKMPIGRQESGI
jgi:hypothetical protein